MLQIADPRERFLVSLADAALRVRALGRRRIARVPRLALRRILALRLERIGDLMMSLPAFQVLRELAPAAEIDLVVGSWNTPLARLIPGITRVETMDAGWLSRGAESPGFRQLLAQARGWRARQYDLAINLEGDIRSNVLLDASGARWRAGFGMAGGGPLLDSDVLFSTDEHTATNGVRLIREALGQPNEPESRASGSPLDIAASMPRGALAIPADADARASALLAAVDDARELVGIQVGAGRVVKMWPVARFGDVAARLVTERDAAVVLTGAPEDAASAAEVLSRLPAGARVVNLVGSPDLVTLAAVLRRLTLFITPDTGPMHLAAVLDTPVVGIFGPSSPDRWGPLAPRRRIVHVDLWCRPCNRIRKPPARCVGHTPECLESLSVDAVYRAAIDLLAETSTRLEART